MTGKQSFFFRTVRRIGFWPLSPVAARLPLPLALVAAGWATAVAFGAGQMTPRKTAYRPAPRPPAHPRVRLATPRPPLAWDRRVDAVPSRGNFHRSFRVKATAYRPINTRMEGGRWTATQRDGRHAHGIAVDPRLIPLGTHVWVPGYGHAVADDTGGRIKGHHIDLRVQENRQMQAWGTRQVHVYVLDEPTR